MMCIHFFAAVLLMPQIIKSTISECFVEKLHDKDRLFCK